MTDCREHTMPSSNVDETERVPHNMAAGPRFGDGSTSPSSPEVVRSRVDAPYRRT